MSEKDQTRTGTSPRQPRPPDEAMPSTRTRDIVIALIVSVALFVSANLAFRVLVFGEPVNFTYVLLGEKWRLIEKPEKPLDLLILGGLGMPSRRAARTTRRAPRIEVVELCDLREHARAQRHVDARPVYRPPWRPASRAYRAHVRRLVPATSSRRSLPAYRSRGDTGTTKAPNTRCLYTRRPLSRCTGICPSGTNMQ